jgi:hypothetical protein
MKKVALVVLCLTILLQSLTLTMITADVVPQKVVYDEFVDVSITAGSKDFYIYALKKQFGEATYVEGNVTFSQVDKILPWVQYTANYNTTTKILTAFDDKQRFVIKAGNLSYTLNGKLVNFTKAPKDIKGKLMVPTEELFKALGYTVQVDAVAKTVRISKFKDYKIGKFAFYNKSTTSNNFYNFDNIGLTGQSFKDITINELYSYGGNIIGYVYDKIERYNKLVKYENGSFVNLQTNFDIVSTYEFGNSRVFYGFDNRDKKYKLVKYDGISFTLVVDDCYSTVQINFKDSIILNKYDSNRNYTIVKVDQFFNIIELDRKKTMTEHFISDNWLYMKTKPQEGTDISFLVFNGSRIVKVNLPSSILPTQVTKLEFDDIRICKDRIFLLLNNTANKKKLYELKEDKLVAAPNDNYDSNFNLMESYNGKLYLNGPQGYGFKNLYHTFEYVPSVIYTSGTNTSGIYTVIEHPKFKDKNLKFEKSRVENGTLFLTGKVGRNERYPDVVLTSPTEDVMYVHKGGDWNYAMDIKKIDTISESLNGLYLKVTDIDRSANASRNSILFVDNTSISKPLDISNIALDFSATHEAVIDSIFYFAGSNKIMKKIGVNSHQYGNPKELIRGFTISYWNPLRSQIFCGGKEDTKTSLYKITTDKVSLIKGEFETKLVMETKDPNLYLVYGTERDKTMTFNGNKVLYLYNINTNTFTLVTVGIEIDKSIRLN